MTASTKQRGTSYWRLVEPGVLARAGCISKETNATLPCIAPSGDLFTGEITRESASVILASLTT
jgi:hypothetical protein